MHHLALLEQNKALDERIRNLADRISKLRNPQLSDGVYDQDTLSRECSIICERLAGDRAATCIQKCTRPVYPVKLAHQLKDDYPYDVQLLDQDHQLFKAFERHQLASCDDMIPLTTDEADTIVTLYSMPIAAVLLPEEAWSRSLQVLQHPSHSRQRKVLMDSWARRRPDYPSKAWKELTRKIQRHDEKLKSLLGK